MENKVMINEETIRKLIIVMIILSFVTLLMLFMIIRLQLLGLYFDSFNYKEVMEFNHFVRFRLPYFRFN